jgi:8-oxo-dGTP pyrophosphatase MutT (NUDIX family)
LPADAITVDYRPELPVLPNDLMLEVAADWRERLAKPDAPHLTDDPVAQLLSFEARDDRLTLRLGRSRYSHWLHSAGRQTEVEARHGAGSACRPLALCAAVLTPQGRLIVQRRSDRVAEGAGLLHVPGGHLDPDRHRLHGLPDPRVAMLCELREELGLEVGELREGRLLGLIENRENGKPELLYRWRTPLEEAEIRERAAVAEDSFEADELLFLAADDNWSERPDLQVAVPSRALREILN